MPNPPAPLSPAPMRPWLPRLLGLVLALAAGPSRATLPARGFVTPTAEAGSFTLVAGDAAPIVLDDTAFPGVRRVAAEVAEDIRTITGVSPRVEASSEAAPAGRRLVLVGTVGRDRRIDRLLEAGRLDAEAIRGKREAFLVQTVPTPWPGCDSALVIAGSDKRGTIYGLYTLSRDAGVSPWAWWADVPIPRHAELHVRGGAYSDGEPHVRYRGIFINDEAPALAGWAHEKFGGCNSQFYARVYQLILRLRGNYLWPAMWGRSLWDDDPASAPLADEYGVVLGTSHHEPMLRAHVEWARHGRGAWNYGANAEVLRGFWEEGLRRSAGHETIVTIGMRGDGDEAMSEEADIDLLQRIIADQRGIIERVTGSAAEETPQLWALYKEVQEYYDRGMRVPDDVTLLLCDDNWGNIRRLPAIDAPPRAGGFGVYYHFDYVGGPRNYKWINTNPLPRVWEQMSLAYEHGVDSVWIVNVGDLKPMELPISFFLDMAWNPEAMTQDRLAGYTRQWAAEQFGGHFADDIGDLLAQYAKFNGRRKPELLAPETYSLDEGREFERVVAEYNDLARRADRIAGMLPDEFTDAFEQLVRYPVGASATLNELYLTVAKNHQYARQRRSMTNTLAARAEELFRRDAELARRYNEDIAAGKWSHMMDQTNIGYNSWQQPETDIMPTVQRVNLPEAASLGVALEGDARWWPDTDARAELLGLCPFARGTRFIELFNRGRRPLQYRLQCDAPWVLVDGRSVQAAHRGEIHQQARFEIGVNWDALPPGRHTATLVAEGSDGARVPVHIRVAQPELSGESDTPAFVESGGVISIHADRFTRSIRRAGVGWDVLPDHGRTGSAVAPRPFTAASVLPGSDSPRLEYDVQLITPGDLTLAVYASPTQDYPGRGGLRYAVSINDEPPRVVNLHADTSSAAWEHSVASNINLTTSTHRVASPGRHTLKLWMVDPGVVVQKLVLHTCETKPTFLGPPNSPTTTAARVRMPDPTPPRPPAADAGPDTGRSAVFDWFEYQGRDEVFEQAAGRPGEYLNPILAGFYPDPSITRVGPDFYLVHSTFCYFPGIPIFHSRDLVHWTQIGNVIHRREQLGFDGLGLSRGVFAPSIEHHDGVFYVLNTCVDCGGNFVVTATNPAGPWSDPVWLPEVDGIDPSLFFDDDGRAYIINNGSPIGPPRYEGHRALWIQEFDAKGLRTFGPRTMIVDGGSDPSTKPIWIEGPHIFRHEGRYYLISAEGGTSTQHSQVVFRGDSPTGPWQPFPGNPILTQRHLDPARANPITSAGHADFVSLDNGEWWATFLATRPYEGNFYNTGRETFLMPVHWQDGWPVMTRGDQLIPFSAPRPGLPATPPPEIPTTGNFIWRDEFDGPELSSPWLFVRAPRQPWHDFASTPGALTIAARTDHIGSPTQPSFIARRLQHTHATVSTRMRYLPSRPGDAAGLVAYQSDDFYHFFGVTLGDEGPVLRVARREGPLQPTEGRVLAERPLAAPSDAPLNAPIDLRIQIDGGAISFEFAEQPGQWKTLLRDADARGLSTQSAGGFVGATLGPYAFRAPATDATNAAPAPAPATGTP